VHLFHNFEKVDPVTNQQQKGVTLIELMIVVAIIGVLASVALPSYRRYVARVATTELLLELGAARLQLEEFYSLNNRFPLNSDNLTFIQPVSKYILRLEYKDATASTDFQTSVVARGTAEFLKFTDGRTTGAIWLKAKSNGLGTGIEWTCMSSLPQEIIPNRCTYSTGQ
jgi:type IV pilus assembly protein PilA